jgi:exodeoxyribonuclease VII large subunit
MFEQLSFLGSASSQPYTVSQLNGRIRGLIEEDPALRDLWVEGEVSNFVRASSGHCYFTLKDANAEIRCVMWRSDAERQGYLPTDGDSVLSHGRVGVYEVRGLYQLYVDQIRPAGIGDLYAQFERVKARLKAEGLFAPERKKPLPRFPECIGVVTSPKAAALQDILYVLNCRFPLAKVLVSPTPVQGDAAPPQVVAAIEALNERDDVDVMIVARGGGSLEELWAFNEEAVARAVAASRIPVICGVGHETDFSLADLAADVRAPTPSAAAELVVPDQEWVRAQLRERATALGAALGRIIEERRWGLAERVQALKRFSPVTRLMQTRQRIDDLLGRSERTIHHELSLHQERLNALVSRLSSISPMGTLDRGYAIVRSRKTDNVVRSIEQVAAGDRLGIRLVDGECEAEVK